MLNGSPSDLTRYVTDNHRDANTQVSSLPSSELKIIQEQVGHEHAGTTSLYTSMSSDFRTRTPQRHLDAPIAAALQTQTGRHT
ncbi:hypothetical protein [Streptomyces acidicola]|uniref:hypothetical protein n=1 Tax=Streptomyces acidicola TaxID=2596892 RepID=UPI00188321CB|nr:hypothetical protein [Streptomyces acidicola]